MKKMILPIAVIAVLAGAIARGQDPGLSSEDPNESMMGGGSTAKTSTRILRLEKMDAEATARMLKELMGPGERITAYSRINCLVIHATDEQHKQIEKLLKQLGELVAANPNRTEEMMGSMDGVGPGSTTRSAQTTSRGALLSPKSLKQRYADSEKRAFEVAKLLRESMKKPIRGVREIETLEKRLRESVTESFQYRQDQHRAEIASLETRIQKMKTMLDARDKIKKEIIDRRVADLKNPNRRWDSEEEKRSVPATPLAQQIKLQGQVTAVRDKDKFVEISIGADDGLKKGMTFIVIRKGLHVGQAEVIEVVPERAIGRVVQEDLKLAPVQVGDQVETPGASPARTGSPIGLPAGPAIFPMGPMSTLAEPVGRASMQDAASPELEKLIQAWVEQSEKVQTLQGGFHQFIYNGMDSVETRATGDFFYRSPGKTLVDVRAEAVQDKRVSQRLNQYGKPLTMKPGDAERWISDGKVAWQISPKSKQAYQHPVEKKNRDQNIVNGPAPFLYLLAPRDVLKRFHLKLVREDSDQMMIELTERNAFGDGILRQRATVILSKVRNLPIGVKLVNSYLETVYTFHDLQVNRPEPNWVKSVFPEESKSFQPDLKGFHVTTIKEPWELARPKETNLQLKLAGPESATAVWTNSDKIPSAAVILPGRIDVPADGEAIFELENLPGHPNLNLFGSFTYHAKSLLRVWSFIRHIAVNVEFTEEDIAQAAAGNLVTKVYFIPNRGSAIDVLVSSKLDPSVDVLEEADRRGHVVGVLRLGNRDGEIGEGEDWHEKFLNGYLKTLDSEREQVQEDLAVCEDALIEAENEGRKESSAKIKEQIAELKQKLAGIDERRAVYEQKLQAHAGAKSKAKTRAEN